MKHKLILIFLLASINLVSQNFNGKYKSYLTSFKNELDSTKNYKEKAEFNLLITDVYIVIQDIRLPEKPLIYKCKKPLKSLPNLYVKEKCINEHLENNSTSTITFYRKENNLNLMTSDINSSQVFFGLQKTIKK
ncbi:hypothetical protein [Tenacibaculum maritimum]|uniref:hypothetical protein n=1 Tax=Tenacibaculum maritimum TaxID=107401 RepID=UPI0012E50E2E|nr:hypothetical protein [Tenacibaculum maritimum]CAA0236353.1 conserved hypothetical protein [Tenacibaculum maritimum]